MAALAPVLLLGGSGALGGLVARFLREAQPGLPLAVGARDQNRARAVAEGLGHARAVPVDLSRPDLGLSADDPFSLVVVLLRDLSYNSVRFAQDRGIGVIVLSEAAFEIAPIIALHAIRPEASPILLLGHSHGGLPSLFAGALAREFSTINSIRVGVVFDPDDPMGPGSQADMARITRAGPPPLALRGGAWTWADEPPGATLRSGFGEDLAVEAVGLLDVVSLGFGVPSPEVVLLASEGRTARDAAGRASHEVIVEIEGVRRTGERGAGRWALSDPEGNVALGARGVALAVQRMVGLVGGPPPSPGLYLPERLISPAMVLNQIEAWGLRPHSAEGPI